MSNSKFKYYLSLFLLLSNVFAVAQTNNFILGIEKGYKYNEDGRSIVPFNISDIEFCTFSDFPSYGISDWQGNPLLYLNGCQLFKYPENKVITNGDSIEGYIFGSAFVNYDTSNYLSFNIINNSSNGNNGPLYNRIIRNNQSETGFEIPTNGKNITLPPVNGTIKNTASTKDSLGQPVFICKTTDGFYSYKTLEGGEVVLMDSFPFKRFIFTPDSILQKQGFVGGVYDARLL